MNPAGPGGRNLRSHRQKRNHHNVVLITPEQTLPFLLQHADDLKRVLANADHPAHGVTAQKEFFGRACSQNTDLFPEVIDFRLPELSTLKFPSANLEEGKMSPH